MSIINYALEGPRIFFKSWQHRFFPKKYHGNAEEICRKIVKDCWNGRFFQTSTANFSQFWTRDFGWCTQSLLKLGYTVEIHKTLRYALNRFLQANRVTTTITPKGRPFDFPCYGVDSLPWLIHSIKVSKFPYHTYKDFLNKEINRFFNLVIDKENGLVKKDKKFSSMKDYAIRESSCYDNCMVALLAKDLKEMKLLNPLTRYNYPNIIKENFWQGQYFYDDLTKKEYLAGDANLFPFLFNIITDKEMLSSTVREINAAGLDHPFPLKYTSGRESIKFIPQEILVRNYETDSVWMHMGPLYVKLLQQVDKEMAEEFKERYTKTIEKHKNFLEVFTADGQPYSNLFYYCDEGMLWAANYLTL